MPKRKGADDSAEDDFSAGASDQHESDAASTSQEEVSVKSKKKVQQGKSGAPANKKAKSTPVALGSSSKKQGAEADGTVKVNSEGDKYIDLGKKKRAVVRSFKGVTLIDIREYYVADGDEKPGKKGISLTPDQWKILKESSNDIDGLLSELEKKK